MSGKDLKRGKRVNKLSKSDLIRKSVDQIIKLLPTQIYEYKGNYNLLFTENSISYVRTLNGTKQFLIQYTGDLKTIAIKTYLELRDLHEV